MRIGLVVLGLVLLLAAGPARADGYDETEYRLKTAGIDEDLRERIHAAIRRGVASLRTLQQADGSIERNPGYTVLAGLALRHAAIPEGVEGARAAIDALRKDRTLTARSHRYRPEANTYVTGLLAMLLTADGSHPEWNRAHHDALAKGPQKDAGYWGYNPAGGTPSPNLSTAQFACLGLWAGERAGAPVASSAWRLHLDALLLAQQPEGSWGYSPGAPRGGAGAEGYPTGTFMGLADLTLAAEALRDELRDDPRRWDRALLASAVARGALRRHVAWELDAAVLPVILGNMYAHYRLYALEKVCIFLDVEELAGRRWYEEGARRLLAEQRPDGSWDSSGGAHHGLVFRRAGASIDTSFALLFLLRASQAYHPITPRPVDRPPVITPGDDPDELAEPPKPPATPLAEAGRVVDELETWLVRRSLDSPGRALDAFADIQRIHAEYRPAGTPRSEPHDAWCRRAETALLQAATRFVGARPMHRPRWQAVAIHALDTLAVTDRRVAPALMRAIQGMEDGPAFPDPVRIGWYSAAFDALRRLDAPALAPWLVERMLVPDRKAWPRTSTALTTLGGIRDLRGLQRHAAVSGILTRLAPLLKRSEGDATTRNLQIDALVAVHRLAAAHADDFPALDGGTMRILVQGVQSWWLAHRARSSPVWAD